MLIVSPIVSLLLPGVVYEWKTGVENAAIGRLGDRENKRKMKESKFGLESGTLCSVEQREITIWRIL